MAFTFYGSTSEAAELSGLAEVNLTEAMQSAINEWINLNIREYGFFEVVISDEYYSIMNDNQKELILEKYPIISKESVEIVDDVNSNSPVIVDESCYHVDLNSGLIQLIPKSLNSSTAINNFTKGIHSVKVSYSYGYSNVPSDIAKIATLLLAKWGKVSDLNSDADGLKNLKIGDYSESKDLSFMSVESEFDVILSKLISQAKIKYAIV